MSVSREADVVSASNSERERWRARSRWRDSRAPERGSSADERRARIHSVDNCAVVAGLSPEDAIHQLGADIDSLRQEIDGLVFELDRRRHALLDVGGQLRRHVPAVSAIGLSLVGALAAAAWFGVRRARWRATPVARTIRAGQTATSFLRSLIDRSNPRLQTPSATRQIMRAAGTAAISTIAARAIRHTVNSFIDRLEQPAPSRERSR